MGRMEITQISQFWLAWYQWIITVKENKILLLGKKKNPTTQLLQEASCWQKEDTEPDTGHSPPDPEMKQNKKF